MSLIWGAIGYLGHIIGRDGLRPDPEKVEELHKMDIHVCEKSNCANVHKCLGCVNYFHNCLPEFSKRTQSLRALLKMNEGTKKSSFKEVESKIVVKVHWKSEHTEAVEWCKQALTSAPLWYWQIIPLKPLHFNCCGRECKCTRSCLTARS